MPRIFILVILLFCQYSFALTPVSKFTHFDESNGLVQAVVSATQDKQGFLWFGTEGNNGVFKYDGIDFIQYKHDPNNKNSLVSGSIYSIVTDNQGDIWFASEGGGISRFNPVTSHFTNYTNNPDDTNSISNNHIYSLLADSQGNIWISTIKSLDKYSLKDDTFTHYYPDNSDPNAISLSMAYHFYESKDGTIWIGTYGNGLASFDPKTEIFKSYHHDPNNPDTIAHSLSGAIIEDDDGYIWVGGKAGLNRLDRNTGKFSHYIHENNNPNSLLDNFVWDIVKGEGDEIWLASFGGGLSRFNVKTGKVTRLPHNPLSKNSVSSNLVFFLFIDKSDVLWAGTVNGGLNKYNFSSEQFKHYNHVKGDKNSFTADSIFTIFQSSDEKIWLGYQGHNTGLTMWNREDCSIQNYLPADNSIPKEEILSIFEDSQNRLYIGQQVLSIFNREDKSVLPIFPHAKDMSKFYGKSIRKIVEDKQQNLWLATEAGLAKIYPDRKHYEIIFPGTSIRTLLIDNQDFLWVGTGAEGIKKYNTSINQYKEFIHDKNNNATISSGEILSIYQDKSSRIWAGSVGGGLNLLNEDGNTFTHYSSKDGFSSNTIFSIQEDDAGFLWMGSSWGLIKFDPSTKAVNNFTEFDGLQGNEFSIRSNGSMKGKDGLLYFVGKKGLTVFDPLTIKLNETPPPVVITSIKLFNQEYESDISPAFIKQLDLSWEDNMFSINFAALDYNSPQQNKYMYKMEGFDKQWIKAGKNTSATYTNLDGGKYTFRVKASNNHGTWNAEGISLPINISPPWWQTWWAFTLLFTVACCLVFLKISQVEDKKRQLEKEVKIRTLELDSSLTELKETQEQLVESGKMAALGRLVAGVAHEINTPLGVGMTGISHIHETTNELAKKMKDNQISKSYLNQYIDTALQSTDIAMNNMQRAANLIQNFKSVAVDQTSENVREFKIVEYIQQILNSLSPKLKKDNHRVLVNYSHDFSVYSCPGALAQIITNLIQNSLIHGFENIENGIIDIDVIQRNESVRIEYRDNGCGIPADVIPLIFEPFFTTKRKEGGSGLGTHILFNLVTQTLQGKIKCIDTDMNGCFFEIDFPRQIALKQDDAE